MRCYVSKERGGIAKEEEEREGRCHGSSVCVYGGMSLFVYTLGYSFHPCDIPNTPILDPKRSHTPLDISVTCSCRHPLGKS